MYEVHLCSCKISGIGFNYINWGCCSNLFTNRAQCIAAAYIVPTAIIIISLYHLQAILSACTVVRFTWHPGGIRGPGLSVLPDPGPFRGYVTPPHPDVTVDKVNHEVILCLRMNGYRIATLANAIRFGVRPGLSSLDKFVAMAVKHVPPIIQIASCKVKWNSANKLSKYFYCNIKLQISIREFRYLFIGILGFRTSCRKRSGTKNEQSED